MTLPPQPQSRHPTLYCADCDHRLDDAYRRRPCPWCGGIARRLDFGGGRELVHNPETVQVSARVMNQSQLWWLAVPMGLTGVGAWLCFISMPPLLAAIVTVAIGIVGLLIPPWRSKIVERVRQIV